MNSTTPTHDQVSDLTPAKRLIVPVLLALIVTIAYAWASWDNRFIYDDFSMILEPPALQSVGDALKLFVTDDGTGAPYYRPLTRLTLLGQKALHGNQPRPFHLFNAMLAGAMVLATYALLRRPGLKIGHWPAVFAATMLGVHPTMSSCVYPAASGRETLLPALCMVLALWAYLGTGWKWYALSLLLLACSLAGKEQSIVLPAMLLLADQWRLSTQRRSWRERIVRHIPMALIVTVYLVIRQSLYGGSELKPAIINDPSGPLYSLLFSVQTLLLPHVELVYEPPVTVWWSWWRVIAGLAVVGVLIHRGWVERRAAAGVAMFWLSWFILTQLPSANILEQEAKFAQRYTLLALLSLLAVTGTFVSLHWRRPVVRSATLIGGCVLSVILLGISIHRARYFHDELTFRTQWITTNPDSAMGHYGLGQYHSDREQYEQAVHHYQLAVAQSPNLFIIHNNLAQALSSLGRLDEAKHHYSRAIELKDNDAKLYINLGSVLEKQGQSLEAIRWYDHAISLDAKLPEAYLNKGMTLLRLGQDEQALQQYRLALRIKPDMAAALNNVGRLLAARGQAGEALDYYDRAIKADPTYALAHSNRGQLLLTQGKLDEAMQSFNRAVERDPRLAPAYAGLGQLHLMRNNLQQARVNYEKALELSGDWAEVLFNLANVYAQLGLIDQATQLFQRMTDRWPEDARLRLQVAAAFYRLGDNHRALQQFDHASRLQPQAFEPFAWQAWILATSSDASIRDAQRALALATRACELTQYQHPQALDSLAAAHAQAGQFDQATHWAGLAAERAQQAGQAALAQKIRERLQGYQANQPFRQE